jgi:IS5 family transposase
MSTILGKLAQVKARIRAIVEHPFRVINRQFGHMKVFYRGLAKNSAQLRTLFVLSNLWMVRRKLLQEMWKWVPPKAARVPRNGAESTSK